MKKVLSILLLLSLITVLAACKDNTPPVEVDCALTPEHEDCSQEVDCSVTPEHEDCNEPEPETQNIDELIQAFNSSVYANSELNAPDFGLADPTIVGVIPEEANQVLYAIDESTFDGEILEFESLTKEKLVASGVIQAADEVDLENDYYLLQYNLELAKTYNDAGTKALIKLPDRVINIHAQHAIDGIYCYVLTDFDGLYIKGQENTEFLIEIVDLNWKGFMNVLDSKDVHFESIKIDYKIPSVVAGTITDTDAENGTVEFSVSSEFNELVSRLIVEYPMINSYLEFDSIIMAPRQGANLITFHDEAIDGYTITGDETLGYTFTIQFSEWYKNVFNAPPKGDYVSMAFSMYVYNGFNIDYSEDIYFENITMYTAQGMGLRAEATHNMYINNFDFILREGSDRLMTTTADGMHFATCTGDIFINGSIFDNTHDDALNIKSGYYYSLSDFDTVERKIILSKKTEGMPAPSVGGQIEMYDSSTFELNGVLTIVSIEGDENSYHIVVEESIGRMGIADWDDTVATFVGDIAKFHFTNNIVRNKRNRGILVQTRGAIISNNHFENISQGALSILSFMDHFNETTVPRDMTITNNKFINNNYSFGLFGDIAVFAEANYPAPVGTITGIEVSNNYITRNGNAAVFFEGVSEANIKNNLFFNVARVYQNDIFDTVINLTNSGLLTIEGNYNYDALSSDSQSGVVTVGLSDKTTITLEENYKIKYQVIEGSEIIVEVPKVDGSLVTIDGDISEWDAMGTDIDIIGYSLATGEEITKASLEDVFEVKTAKFAWDEEGIYIVFDIKDDLFDFKTKNDFWVGDCVELFMSTITTMPSADMSLYKEDGGVLQGAFASKWGDEIAFGSARTNSAIIDNADLFKVKVIETSEGYSGEIYIPFTAVPEFKTAIDNEETISIAIVFADSERPDGRSRVQVANVEHFVEAYKLKTAKMPKYLFVD